MKLVAVSGSIWAFQSFQAATTIWQDSHVSDGEAGTGLPRPNDGEARFSAYMEGLTSVIGHADRAKPLRDYCLGLMMPCESDLIVSRVLFSR